MATEEIEISELEFTEELASDNLIPVESSTDTKATSLQILKNWLSSFFVGKTEDETITGQKTLTKPITARMNTVEENTPPTQNQYIDWITPVDKNGLGIGYLGVADYADGRRGSRIGHTRTKSDGSKVYASIDVGTDKNGTTYTSAPNPPSSSNGTAIATTSWVNNAGAVVKSKSLANNGYIKFSSGLIIQWGREVGTGTVTFPTPFTSDTSYSISNSYGGTGAGDHFYGTVNTLTSTGFKWVKYGSTSAEYWLAIGY